MQVVKRMICLGHQKKHAAANKSRVSAVFDEDDQSDQHRKKAANAESQQHLVMITAKEHQHKKAAQDGSASDNASL